MSLKKAAAKKEDPAYGFAQKRRTPTDSGSSSVFSIAQGGANVNSRLEHAPEKENADGVGVYDLDKSRASNWFSDGRVQFPAISDQAGLIYSISDAGSPVKRKELEQTPKNKVRGSKNLYAVAGVQFPGKSLQGGLNHTISDAGSPVKREEPEQTPKKGQSLKSNRRP